MEELKRIIERSEAIQDELNCITLEKHEIRELEEKIKEIEKSIETHYKEIGRIIEQGI